MKRDSRAIRKEFFSRQFQERFWSYVDRSAGPDACWPWTRSKLKFGHGQIGGQSGDVRWMYPSHRVAYALHHGLVPEGQCVLHHCDNPPCCNPKHLFLGTRVDNMADMNAKGRHNYRTHRGTDHGNAKLTDGDVREMRRAYAAKEATQCGLATRFGLTQATVWAILHRKTWKHVA